MKIDLAVWTAVNGYDWQPGSVYSPKELAGYKDAIGPLVPDSLPLGGLFLKDGKAVFYRVQIAERMDSRGRGAIYCVLGTVPEYMAEEVDFSAVFNSAEMAQPQKPFPTAIEHQAGFQGCKSPLGHSAFEERRFTGAETFSELGGWCGEAKGGKLAVRITGSMDAPLFTVKYTPHAEPAPEPPKSKQQPQPRQRNEEKSAKPPRNSFLSGFIVGAIFGVILAATVAWLAWPSKKENPDRHGVPAQQPQDVAPIEKASPQNSQPSPNPQQSTEEPTDGEQTRNAENMV